MVVTVKLEMFADINVYEFVILKIFCTIKVCNFRSSQSKFSVPIDSVLLLLLLVGYIR